MATQQRVGLLPEWRAGDCPGDFDYSVATGSDLGGLMLLVPSVENVAESLEGMTASFDLGHACGIEKYKVLIVRGSETQFLIARS
jgi:hypothetical protein